MSCVDIERKARVLNEDTVMRRSYCSATLLQIEKCSVLTID